MKPAVKNTLIVSGLLLGAVALFAYEKIERLKRVFENLIIRPKNFRELKVSLTNISFVVDLLITNPTNENFDVSGYVATLRRVNFFYNGNYVGTAKPQISEIDIPAKNQLQLNNIPVVLPAKAILQNIMEITAFDLNKLSVEAVVSIAGTEYYIK